MNAWTHILAVALLGGALNAGVAGAIARSGPDACPQPPATPVVDFGEPVPLSVPSKDGVVDLRVWVADEPEEFRRGLMFRDALGPDEGMVFLFEDDRPRSMWNKNVCIPLDMVFIAADGRITGIARHAMPFSERLIHSPGPAPYVLELAGGRAKELGLLPGDRIDVEAIRTAWEARQDTASGGALTQGAPTAFAPATTPQ